ncbi:2-nitropropane dioxygenase [Mycena filopes]|nr:2-nitropropane dioxygenase [Mycena filopes]
MEPIVTKFTKLLNLKSPLVSAPMTWATTPSLAAAVSKAGGLGMIAGGPHSPIQMKEQLRAVRASLDIPDGVPVPVGVGLIGWILDKTEITEDPRIPAVLEEMPTAIWFAFGAEVGKYVAQVRAYDSNRPHKTCIFVMVHSVEEALRAANVWKVDVIVVQGIEAGGHGHSKAPPLLTFLQAVKNSLPPGGPCILAAGGISSGEHIAGLLTMGADGVVLGTRFLYTHECMYSEAMKSVLVSCAAGSCSTVRGKMFDEVFVLPFKVEWPQGINGRGIANKIADDVAEGLSIEERIRRVEEAKAKGETDRLVIWAGEGVGLVKEIESTADVFRELHENAVASLKNSRLLLHE